MKSINGILFLDIETVGGDRDINPSAPYYNVYRKRFAKQIEQMEHPSESIKTVEHYRNNAALHPEFGKIISLTIGMVKEVKDVGTVYYVRTFIGNDEATLLTEFNLAVEKSECTMMCAHNGHDFDYPYIYRRCIVNSVPVNHFLNPIGKKPWTLSEQLLDTVKLWGGTQYKSHVSLDTLACLFGLPSPKSDISGDQIHKLYHERFDHMEKDELPFDVEDKLFKRIGTYNQGDVVTNANVLLRMIGLPPLEKVVIVEK